VPLAIFLKNYFRQQPKLGSRDRKVLSSMAYSWYRCEKGVSQGASVEDKVAKCLELCEQQILQMAIAPSQLAFELDALFPYEISISEGITRTAWLESMLRQPDMFIRIRKDVRRIEAILQQHSIPYKQISEKCIALPNGTKADAILPATDYVVQDASSQATGDHFEPKKQEQWWDCCCGAGGKSLLLKDLEPSVRLTVSDRRDSIIHNLKQRFKLYGHQLPMAIVTDIADAAAVKAALGNQLFDNIICDAPCSGSGTWARTPEQLYFFDPASINKFSTLQTAIAVNAAKHLKPGGKLFYITCSVFAQENDQVVAEVVRQTGLEVLSGKIINGISIHADSMYIAELQKKSPLRCAVATNYFFTAITLLSLL
jgi:16S rRNA (cytosine967-C5)-methyltransferase